MDQTVLSVFQSSLLVVGGAATWNRKVILIYLAFRVHHMHCCQILFMGCSFCVIAFASTILCCRRNIAGNSLSYVRDSSEVDELTARNVNLTGRHVFIWGHSNMSPLFLYTSAWRWHLWIPFTSLDFCLVPGETLPKLQSDIVLFGPFVTWIRLIRCHAFSSTMFVRVLYHVRSYTSGRKWVRANVCISDIFFYFCDIRRR